MAGPSYEQGRPGLPADPVGRRKLAGADLRLRPGRRFWTGGFLGWRRWRVVSEAQGEYLLSMSTPAPGPADKPAPGEVQATGTGTTELGTLRPEDFAADGLPVAMRGYDRRRVEWLLLRASEGYAHVLRQRDALRERTRSLEAEVAAAESEARVSAASVAELVQRASAAETEAARLREGRLEVEELEERLLRVEREREQAVSDLRESAARVAELDARVQAFEEAGERAGAGDEEAAPSEALPASSRAGSDDEAGRLLLAAVRAADELRESSRARALGTLQRARERAASVDATVERERTAVAEMEERRREAERIANEMLAQARAEAERVAAERREAERLAAEISDERSRVRQFLVGALSALDPGGDLSESLLADLSSRLPEAGERDDSGDPARRADPGA